MTARDDVLRAARELRSRGKEPFSPAELIAEARRQGSIYKDSTLRTHVVGVMCENAADHWAVKYGDLRRVGRGRYQLVVAADGYAVRKRASASDLLTSLARSSPAPPSVKARVPPSRSLRRTSGRGRETFRPL